MRVRDGMFIENHPGLRSKLQEERNCFAHKWGPVNKKTRLFYKHRIPTGFPEVPLRIVGPHNY